MVTTYHGQWDPDDKGIFKFSSTKTFKDLIYNQLWNTLYSKTMVMVVYSNSVLKENHIMALIRNYSQYIGHTQWAKNVELTSKWCQQLTSTDLQHYIKNESFDDIKLVPTVDIKLMSHIDIYLTIQLDVNLTVPNLIYVHETKQSRSYFYA